MSDETTEKKEETVKVSETVHDGAEAPKADKDVDDNKIVAALSYLGPLFFIPLFLKRESSFCQFHAKQGLALFIVWIVGKFVFWFPILGWALAVVVAILNIMALIKALNGEKWEMPVIGDFAKKINI